MTLLPRSLFGRLVLLLVIVVALAVLTSIFMFRQDRAALLARQFSDTKIVQLKALRAALASAEGPQKRDALAHLNHEYGVRIVPEAERPNIGIPAGGPPFEGLEERLREALGPETEIRFAPRMRMLLVRITAGDAGYWIGLPMPPRPEPDLPERALTWTLVVLVLLLIAAYVFARILARPLRDLTAAVGQVGRGETPSPLPESGPSEIAAVNRGFNTMLGNLRQMEEDRAILLAGVSHDLRTPLARLRLGVEIGSNSGGSNSGERNSGGSNPGGNDPRSEATEEAGARLRDSAMKDGMVADIEEMDRIIGQFLDFARGETEVPRVATDLDALVAARCERYAQAGRPVVFHPGNAGTLPLRSTAISRLIANLIDNALAYGRTTVEISTRRDHHQVMLEVADRGPGIPPDQVARLKQPFTRASAARARPDGVAGAGLGLAIVDRIARLHGGTFDLLPREGGGTIARVTLPMSA